MELRNHCGFDSLRLAAQRLILRLLRVRHSRMFLSLDFPRDGEVLEPSGIQARAELDPRPIRPGSGSWWA